MYIDTIIGLDTFFVILAIISIPVGIILYFDPRENFSFKYCMTSSLVLILLSIPVPLWHYVSCVNLNRVRKIISVDVVQKDNKPLIEIQGELVNLAKDSSRNWTCKKVDVETWEESYSYGIFYPKGWKLIGETE